jgi:hypothetical protein
MIQAAAIILAGATSETSTWTVIEAVGAGLTGISAVVASLVALRQLRQTRQMAAERLAHNYLRRYDEPWRLPFIEKVHVVVGRTTQDQSTAALRVGSWRQMPLKDKIEVLASLNFWEELGGMYNRELVDRLLIDEYFGDAALDLFERSMWLVRYQRNQSPGDAIYNEWEAMCLDIRVKRATRPRPSKLCQFSSQGNATQRPSTAPPDSPTAPAPQLP